MARPMDREWMVSGNAGKARKTSLAASKLLLNEKKFLSQLAKELNVSLPFIVKL